MADRSAFENWLITIHCLEPTWNEARGCYEEFAAHLAWKAWAGIVAVRSQRRRETAVKMVDKIAESNRIEGILRPVMAVECRAFERFMNLEGVTIPYLEAFVKANQPDAVLRDKVGLDVRVGQHVPPRGGAHIAEQLQALLDDFNADRFDPWALHLQYETLHPFTDGNGRSGRMLWYWQMGPNPMAELGFLHAFYYQTLQGVRR